MATNIVNPVDYYGQQAEMAVAAAGYDDDDSKSSVAESIITNKTDDSQSSMTGIKCFINAITASTIDSLHADARNEKPRTNQWNLFVLGNFESAFSDLTERKIWHRYVLLLHTEEPTIKDWMVDKICSGFKKFESETLKNVLDNQPDWWEEREWSDSESSTYKSDEEDSDNEIDEEEMKRDTDDESDSQDSRY